MYNLTQTLTSNRVAPQTVLARRWKVDLADLDSRKAIAELVAAMQDPQRAESVWDSLDDQQRGALQTLLGTGGKMPATKFGLLFGHVRDMGEAQVERERPHLNPANTAEALFYRGLIALGFETVQAGPRQIVYVPEELAAVLPTHKTAYQNLETENVPEERITVDSLDEVDNPRPADTTVVDDLTTLLAYLQVAGDGGGMVEEETLARSARDAVMPYMLIRDETRLAFLLGLGLSAKLIEINAGTARPNRAEARRWLEATRAVQVRRLAEAWASSILYRDLWHVPGLHPEPSGWPYDALVARQAVIRFLKELVPEGEWWSLDEFIAAINEQEPDFQRPNGDYDSWYIRNDKGEYLAGIESWNAVEGALIEFYLMGPLHWLGLVDTAEDAARMTAYGRAFLERTPWPTPPDPEDKAIVNPDGRMVLSRKVSRIDRFQVARFTTWGAAGDPYVYKLDAAGLMRAQEQGINTGHIASYITRAMNDAPLPPAIAALLENWQTGPRETVTLERVIVLRTTAPETLDRIAETPALRRYLGARLGPMAALVRASEWPAFRDALGEKGILAETIGLDS